MAASDAAQAPLIHHSPGRYHPLRATLGAVYDRVIEARLFANASLREAFRKPANLEIIICHNYSEKPVTARSLEYLGIADYTHLGGEIQNWKNILKLSLVHEHLLAHDGPEYVLHLDANDVIVNGDPAEVLHRFKTQFDCETLFNAEKLSHPSRASNPLSPFRGDNAEGARIDGFEKFERETYSAPFSFLNAGCYIGRRKSIIEMLDRARTLTDFLPSFPAGDQGILREVHRQLYPRLQIDWQRKIFQSLSCLRRDELRVVPPLASGEFYRELIGEAVTRKIHRLGGFWRGRRK